MLSNHAFARAHARFERSILESKRSPLRRHRALGFSRADLLVAVLWGDR